jgi:hypothetical protein
MRVTLGIALTCLVACGSDNGKPSISTTSDNLCDQIAAVECYDLYQCCSEGEIESDLGVQDPRTQDQCRDDIKKRCERALAPIESSIKAKRVTFDASVMNACLKALLAPDNECATISMDMLPWADACMMEPFTGNVPIGGMCYYTFECMGASMTTGMNGTAYCAPNETCTALPTDNQPCSSTQGCAGGYYCNFTNDTCQALLGQGGACTGGNQCQKGLYCDLSTGTGSCQPLHGGGEPCTGNQSCESNQCLPGQCMRSFGTCYTSANCQRYCGSGPRMGGTCFSDVDCEGHCSTTTTQLCTSSATCPVGPPAETCVLYTCVPDTCVGDIVCGSSQVDADYCTGPRTVLGGI